MASAMTHAMAQSPQESPLTSLVRRASSRRFKPPPLDSQTSQQQLQQTPTITFQYDDDESQHQPPPRNYGANPFGQPLHSPLLHGNFGRDSVATASSYEGNSYLDDASASSSRVHSFSSNAYPDSELDYRYGYDDNAYEESVYSQPDLNSNNYNNHSGAPALRDSWNSMATTSTVKATTTFDGQEYGGYTQRTYNPPQQTTSRADQASQQQQQQRYQQQPQYAQRQYQESYQESQHASPYYLAPASESPLPDVVVTSPETHSQRHTAGRSPIVKPISSNFSRPVRPPGRPPPVDVLSEEQKRQVLLRNSNRQRSQSPGGGRLSERKVSGSSLRHQVSYGGSQDGEGEAQAWPDRNQAAPSPQQKQQSQQQESGAAVYANSPASTSSMHLNNGSEPPAMRGYSSPSSNSNANSSKFNSSSASSKTSMSSSLAPRDALNSQYHNNNNQSHHQQQKQHTSQSAVQPRMGAAEPPRVDSSLSVYSNYSYYPYENPVPSPTGSAFSNTSDPFSVAQRPRNTSNNDNSSSLNLTPPQSQSPFSHQPNQSNKKSGGTTTAPKTAHDFLLLGIEHHEADRLNESARCFERSTVEGGGCGVGMLMWGLTLRHGWGCPKNERMAFKWLQRAAESAVDDLEATRAKGIKDTSVVRTELVLAIYEVGQCFFQGWGVPKDQKMAFSYYTIAAELGDPDAQMDLAFCLTNGKGCKKDKKEAAKWYRAAIKQGQSDVGLAWIYKDKYQ